MREFLARHRPTIVAFFALVVPLFLLYVHGRSPRKTTIIEKALMQVTAPVQGAASRLLSGISDLWNGYIALVDVETENESLRAEVKKLDTMAGTVTVLADENKRLRAMLEFKRARRDLRLIAAHVLGKDVTPYGRVIRIAVDSGADAGLEEGMPVVDGDALVGRVELVAGGNAVVRLTVDPTSIVNVRVQGKGVTGTVTGAASQFNYVSRFSYLHRAEPIEVGDVLVTSGHDKLFPPGLRVGAVRTIEERQTGLEYELQVTPAVNFADLEQVMIVIGVVEGPMGPDAPKPEPQPTTPGALGGTGASGAAGANGANGARAPGAANPLPAPGAAPIPIVGPPAPEHPPERPNVRRRPANDAAPRPRGAP